MTHYSLQVAAIRADVKKSGLKIAAELQYKRWLHANRPKCTTAKELYYKVLNKIVSIGQDSSVLEVIYKQSDSDPCGEPIWRDVLRRLDRAGFDARLILTDDVEAALAGNIFELEVYLDPVDNSSDDD
jgi:hypothetical protein